MYDVIVIGAGHAGCEAAIAAARMGAKAALFTIDKNKTAAMSCNPAIGGLAKGQVVREIDALGGVMAKAADAACIQFKVLNPNKGPAVRGLRAQADKRAYSEYMRRMIDKTAGLDYIEAMAEEVLADSGNVKGIIASGRRYDAKAVIVTTGTFLNGLIHIGMTATPGGRLDDPSSAALAESLKKLGFKLGRMKTGTPPRVDRKSLDFSKFSEQPGDPDPVPFSFSTKKIETSRELCWLVHTNENTKKVIESSLEKSPLYSKTNRKIFGIGPRYCPSIEDKVVKFPDKVSHQVFIEPEEKGSDEMYLNGLSTSLPPDVQEAYLKTIPGFENIKIIRPAYGIEYDYSDPVQVCATMETKEVAGLFFAGQINGTSGYEEAAGQGLVAGINAVLKIRGEMPFRTGRDESYIGVMIDDIITGGITEPYRLFSSRAEHRLVLRNDNADIRLMKYGRKYGLVTEREYGMMMKKKEFAEKEKKRLSAVYIHPDRETNKRLEAAGTPPLAAETDLLKLLKRPEMNYKRLARFAETEKNVPAHYIEYLDAEIKYEGYIKKQARQIEHMRKFERKKIPEGFDYDKTTGLSLEARQKLNITKPETVGQASRINGVTPADISVLLILIKKYARSGSAGGPSA